MKLWVPPQEEPRRRSPARFIVGLLVIGVFLVCGGCLNTGEANRLDADGVTTQATVDAVFHGGRSGKAIVHFDTSPGNTRTADCYSCSDTLSAGDVIDIRYDPRHFNGEVDDLYNQGARGTGTLYYWLAGLTVVASVVLWSIHKSRRPGGGPRA